MARLKKVFDCGCIVDVDYDESVKIVYCAKHSAALGMYKYLKHLKVWCEEHIEQIGTDSCDEGDMLKDIVLILAKAEGK